MLVLTRKKEETLHLGNNITLTILKIKGNSVQIGVEAPRHVRVLRGELASRIEQPKNVVESTPNATPTAKATGRSATRNRLRELASQVKSEAEANCLLQLV